MSLVSEGMRKSFQEKLRQALASIEQLNNTNFNELMTQELAQHHITYLQDQFKILYYAVDNISTDKKFGDTLQFQIKELKG